MWPETGESVGHTAGLCCLVSVVELATLPSKSVERTWVGTLWMLVSLVLGVFLERRDSLV